MNGSKENHYYSFLPSSLPPNPSIVLTNEMQQLLLQAVSKLSILNERSKYIHNFKIYLYMYVRKESLLSSQIEGTQATLEDILDPSNQKNSNLDVRDVINYIKALQYATKKW